MAFAASEFTDVPDGKWYTENVSYVYGNGLMNGVGNGRTETTFAPDDSITRQEVATILHRYTVAKGLAGGNNADLSTFHDYTSISNFALDAMSWAVGSGLLNGSYGNLDPTRAQIAAILNRFCVNVLGDSLNSELETVMAYYAEYAMAYASKNGSDARFGLIYIDADQIPELVLVPGGFRLAQVKVFTWYNNDFAYLGDYGMYGTLPYAPYQNAFGDYSKPMRIVEGLAYEANFDTNQFVEYGYSSMNKITKNNVDKIILGK